MEEADPRSIEKPSALISYHYRNQKQARLEGLDRFKNLVSSTQTELDLNGNRLRDVPELVKLKYLKKLSLKNNKISLLWTLPFTLEFLDLSYNKISHFQPEILHLNKLTKLDLSHNLLTDIKAISEMSHLQYFYASFNKISSLIGIEALPFLVELVVDGNSLSAKEDLIPITLNSSLCVVNLHKNPVQQEFISRELRKVFFINQEFPAGFVELEDGLYYKNPSTQKELKTSRYKTIIRKHLDSEHAKEFMPSPEWGEALDSEGFSPERELNIEKDPNEITLMKEDLIEIAREVRAEIESPPLKLALPIAELQLDSIGDKPSLEGWSTKPKSHLETLFEELITYCHLDDSFRGESFSMDKYEYAVSILKEREDERKDLLVLVEKLETEVANLEFSLKEKSEVIEKLTRETTAFLEVQEKWKQEKNVLKETIAEMSEEQNSLLKKILEQEQEISEKNRMNSSLDFFKGPSLDFSLNTTELSFKQLDESEFLVTKEIGDYIRKLLGKINRYTSKIKRLREERDKIKQAYEKISCKIIY